MSRVATPTRVRIAGIDISARKQRKAKALEAKAKAEREERLQGGILKLLTRMLDFEKPWILLKSASSSILYSVPWTLAILPQHPKIPQKAWILDVGPPGSDSGFCRSIQKSPKSRVQQYRPEL